MISKGVARTVPPAADDKRVGGEGREVKGRFADYAQPMLGGTEASQLTVCVITVDACKVVFI